MTTRQNCPPIRPWTRQFRGRSVQFRGALAHLGHTSLRRGSGQHLILGQVTRGPLSQRFDRPANSTTMFPNNFVGDGVRTSAQVRSFLLGFHGIPSEMRSTTSPPPHHPGSPFERPLSKKTDDMAFDRNPSLKITQLYRSIGDRKPSGHSNRDRRCGGPTLIYGGTPTRAHTACPKRGSEPQQGSV